VSQSALIVRVPEAENALHRLRERYEPSAALGAPAHITILVPFVPPENITPQVLSAATAALTASRSFTFTLTEIGRWPETTYLLAQPAAPFIKMTESLAQAFPDYPPYGGRHSGVVPHLTIAHGDANHAGEAEKELRAILARHGPITSNCRAVDLYENSSGHWRLAHAIPLHKKP
jgi:2'-5' RNA ligase